MYEFKNKNSLKVDIYRKIRYNLLQRHIYGLTSSFRVLPDFLVIGAKRCGTTSLYEYLGQHPCIKKSSHDHIGFFDDNFHLGIGFYKSFFPTIFEKKFFEFKNGKLLTNDVTSSYIQNSQTATKIFQTLPDKKIIVILRNPIDRAYSEYNLDLRANPDIQSFETIIQNEIDNMEDKNDGEVIQNKHYLKRGIYFDQLKPWFELFPKKNILILSTEKFGEDANNIFNIIFKFLNLENYNIKNSKRMQKGTYTKLNSKTREKLLKFYKLKNNQLYDLINEKFDWDK